MAAAEPSDQSSESVHDLDQHKSTYQFMMDVGFNLGLPIGGAVTLFVALVLMGVSPILGLVIGFFTWLGLLGIAKTFFAHH